MATLTWADVVIIGLVATVGFTLLSFWVSGWMARRSISGQLKGKPPRRKGDAVQGGKDSRTAGDLGH